MGQEFLSRKDIPRKSCTEVFYEQLPLYLAIGMSLTEYFESDCTLTRYFRRAYQIRQESEDHNAWLQGAYIYKAFDCALYNNPPLMKRGREARQYFDKPLTVQNADYKTSEEEKALKKEEEEAAMGVWMSNFVNMFKYKK